MRYFINLLYVVGIAAFVSTTIIGNKQLKIYFGIAFAVIVILTLICVLIKKINK